MKVQCLKRIGVTALVVAGIAGPAAAQESAALTLVLNRINDLESQMLNLTNRVEQLDYQVRELNSRVDLLSRDVDFRFSELGASGSGSTGSSGGASAPPPRLETPLLDSGSLTGSQSSATGVTPPVISGGTASTAAGTPEAEFQMIRTMLDNRDFAGADSALRTFIGAHPNHPLSSSAFFWLGEIYFDRGDYQRAAETYAAGFANYPSGYKAADTLLKLGLSLVQLGRPSDACTTFNQLRNAFPNAPINIQQRADQARISAGCG
ncbi:MAG: tol-pal system protein YbgF [Alphaproteobacteria bacterium]